MEYATYAELDGRVDELVDAEAYSEALELLKVARQIFPDHLWDILQYEGSILIRQEEYERCLDTIEEGVTNGLFFGIESWDIFDPFRHTARYQAIEEADRRLKAQAQREAEMAYEVHTPDGCTPASWRVTSLNRRKCWRSSSRQASPTGFRSIPAWATPTRRTSPRS